MVCEDFHGQMFFITLNVHITASRWHSQNVRTKTEVRLSVAAKIQIQMYQKTAVSHMGENFNNPLHCRSSY